MTILPWLIAVLLLLTPEPDFRAQLAAVDARAAAVTDLSAEFEQRKHTPLLRKPLVSSGRVRVAGGTTRWDTQSPSPSVLVLTAETLRLYYPEQRALEEYPIAEGLGRLAATPLPRLTSVAEHFDIRRADVGSFEGVEPDGSLLAIELTPKTEELKKHIQTVRVLLELESGWARQVEMIDADDERTVIIFRKVRANTGLTERELDLVVPPGTRISRPLEGVGGTPARGTGR